VKKINHPDELKKISAEMRLELLRMFSYGKAHHFGGCFSCVELVASLYFYKMNYSIDNMNDTSRDKFIMSKGHTVPTQYVALSRLGIIPKEELQTIKKIGTRLQGHPDINKTPGIEAPTGSLGQGLSYANGMALAGRLDKLDFNIFLILGDGELQEGQVWEAAMTTSQYRLNNICIIVDRNIYQSQGSVNEMMSVEPLDRKWESFGWDVRKVNGHDEEEICAALDAVNGRNSKPVAIIAETVKGKGIPFIENTYKYHNAKFTKEQYDAAEKELQEKLAKVS